MSRRSTTFLLWCGAAGAPLFVIAFLIEGATRPGYNPVRLPISLLSLGDLGWTQTANFILDGVLMLGFAVGLGRSLPSSGWASRSGPILIGLVGLGLLGAGIFSADPGGGYPPGIRAAGSGSSGTLHDLSTLVLFASLVAACAVFSRQFANRRETAWATYSAVTGSIVAAGFILMFIGFSETNDISRVAGLIQRLAVIVGWTWIALLALRQIRRLPETSDPR
jgi:hypothetical protein